MTCEICGDLGTERILMVPGEVKKDGEIITFSIYAELCEYHQSHCEDWTDPRYILRRKSKDEQLSIFDTEALPMNAMHLGR